MALSCNSAYDEKDMKNRGQYSAINLLKQIFII